MSDTTAEGSPTARSTQSGRLARTTVAGVVWLIAQNVGARVTGFASQILLARLLFPADFGELALATTITTLVGVFVGFGIEDVLLQRLRTITLWTAPALWLSLGVGLVSMLALCGAAPILAHLYHTPTLVALLFIAGLNMPLGALSMVPAVLMRSRLEFRFLAIYATVEAIVTQIMMVVLAVAGFGVLSFVIPGPVAALAKAVVFWLMAKPALGSVRVKHLRIMGSRGATIFASRLITATVNQGDYFILGLIASKPVLGAYFFAFRLAIQPIQMLAGNLSTVLFPTLVQLAADPVRQREAAIGASGMLAVVVMPYCFLQAAVAAPLFDLAFGGKWRTAAPLVEILSVGLAFDAVSWVAGSLLKARGEFKRALTYSCLFSPVFFVLVTAGALAYSAIGVATAVSVFYVILAPVYSFRVFAAKGVGLRQVASIYAAPVALSALSMGGAAAVSHLIGGNDVARVGAIVVVGSAAYLALMRSFAPIAYRQVVDRITQALRAKGAARRATSSRPLRPRAAPPASA